MKLNDKKNNNPKEQKADQPTHHPITLYVESVNTKPRVDMGLERRKTTIDLEISVQQLRQMITELNQEIEQMPARGAIRLRFIGRVFV